MEIKLKVAYLVLLYLYFLIHFLFPNIYFSYNFFLSFFFSFPHPYVSTLLPTLFSGVWSCSMEPASHSYPRWGKYSISEVVVVIVLPTVIFLSFCLLPSFIVSLLCYTHSLLPFCSSSHTHTPSTSRQPTNYLDRESLGALANAIAAFEGRWCCVFLATAVLVEVLFFFIQYDIICVPTESMLSESQQLYL